MRKKRMDQKVGKNTRVYHEMMTGTATAFLTLVDLYCILFNNTVEEGSMYLYGTALDPAPQRSVDSGQMAAYP